MLGRDEKVSPVRLTGVQYIILGIFLLLAYGLWRLQVMQQDFYASQAEKNRIRNVPILAPRGKILDREGRTIVDNYPSFTALLLRDQGRDLNADAVPIAQGLHTTSEEIRSRVRHFVSITRYQTKAAGGRRYAACGRTSHGRQKWRHRGYGPAQGRNSGHGEPPHFRSQQLRGAHLA